MKTVTVRQLARRFDPPACQKTAKGVLLGLGAHLERTPAGYLVDERDAARAEAILRREIELSRAS